MYLEIFFLGLQKPKGPVWFLIGADIFMAVIDLAFLLTA